MQQIGSGSFGTVYQSSDPRRVVKVEGGSRRTLGIEYRILCHLKGCEYAPRVVSLTNRADGNRELCMERLGPSLQRIFERDGVFDARRCASVVNNVLCALEAIHDRGILHRDVAPSNLLLSLGRPMKIKLCDFGLSKSFRTAKGGHTPAQEGRGIVGTLRYCSVDCHEGRGCSRRSDVESLVYTVRFLSTGTLPWIGIRGKATERRAAVLRHKRELSWAECSAPHLRELWEHALALGWEERPAYDTFAGACARHLTER